MKSLKNKVALALLATTAASVTAPAAQAQVAGIAEVDKLSVLMGSKAFKDGYNAVATQNAGNISRLDAIRAEITPLEKPFDTDGDGQLSQKDKAWVDALKQRETVIKTIDKNGDGDLTGTERDEFMARNLPAQKILELRSESGAITENIQLIQMFVIDSIIKQYDAALKSVVTAKKINLVLTPGVIVYAAPTVNINKDVVAALDRAVPSVALPVDGQQISLTEEAAVYHNQIKELIIQDAVARQRQAMQQQQQQGAAPQPGQPAPAAPAPAPRPGADPNADNGTGG
jgi:Skp family chaperone for outer membrane proteins